MLVNHTKIVTCFAAALLAWLSMRSAAAGGTAAVQQSAVCAHSPVVPFVGVVDVCAC